MHIEGDVNMIGRIISAEWVDGRLVTVCEFEKGAVPIDGMLMRVVLDDDDAPQVTPTCIRPTKLNADLLADCVMPPNTIRNFMLRQLGLPESPEVLLGPED